ncbi:hypothetical protein [Sorangium sp. So ce363]
MLPIRADRPRWSLLGPQAGDTGEPAKAVWVGAVLVGQKAPRRDDGPRR